MNSAQAEQRIPAQSLRVWPGVAITVIVLLVRFGLPLVRPEDLMIGILGAAVGALLVILWWLFFSRASWVDRIGLLLMVAAIMFATRFVLDKSIATGMMGMMFPIMSLPFVTAAFVTGAVLGRRMMDGPRRALMTALVLIACAGWLLIRTNGMTGDGTPDLAFRWSPTLEDKLLAKAASPAAPVPEALPPAAPAPVAAAPEASKLPVPTLDVPKEEARVIEPAPKPAIPEPPAVWPGFRGPDRDSVVPDVRILTNWSTTPPAEMWRHAVGPGWSSFAVRGDLVYTQEQRGNDEVVACYNATTGKAVWAHRDAARFWESNAGAGPRATPALRGNRIYTFGATGILNALDANNGAALWTHNAASDTGAKLPGWGFAGSPLLTGDLVVVAASGRLAAYDASTGALRWKAQGQAAGYSSPQLATIGGVPQILLVTGGGIISVSPSDGKLLWDYKWDGDGITQPSVLPDGDVLIGAGSGMGAVGVRRIGLKHADSGWTVQERWSSQALKPYFNDIVLRDGYAYGFDGAILACIDLKDGTRKWKGGRYGHGQVILLREQALLLVLSEEGELALVRAAPDQFTELGKVPAIEGKTWNHPALAGDKLLVRNSSEMAAFRLTLERP